MRLVENLLIHNKWGSGHYTEFIIGNQLRMETENAKTQSTKAAFNLC